MDKKLKKSAALILFVIFFNLPYISLVIALLASVYFLFLVRLKFSYSQLITVGAISTALVTGLDSPTAPSYSVIFFWISLIFIFSGLKGTIAPIEILKVAILSIGTRHLINFFNTFYVYPEKLMQRKLVDILAVNTDYNTPSIACLFGLCFIVLINNKASSWRFRSAEYFVAALFVFAIVFLQSRLGLFAVVFGIGLGFFIQNMFIFSLISIMSSSILLMEKEFFLHSELLYRIETEGLQSSRYSIFEQFFASLHRIDVDDFIFGPQFVFDSFIYMHNLFLDLFNAAGFAILIGFLMPLLHLSSLHSDSSGISARVLILLVYMFAMLEPIHISVPGFIGLVFVVFAANARGKAQS